MNTFHLQITTPEGNIFDGMVYQISLRAVDGDLAVMPGHIPMCTAVVSSPCRIYDNNGNITGAKIGSGLLQVSSDRTVLLTSSFVWDGK